MSEQPEPRSELATAFRRLGWATVALYAVLLALLLAALVEGRQERERIEDEVLQTRLALCSFRSDLANNVRVTRAASAAFPSSEAIRLSLRIQMASLSSLEDLDCPLTVTG